MAVVPKKTGEIVLPVKNRLDGSTASATGITIEYLLSRGTENVVLDFSRVRQFEYFGVAVLMDIVLQCGKKRGVGIRIQGLSDDLLAAARHFGLEKLPDCRMGHRTIKVLA